MGKFKGYKSTKDKQKDFTYYVSQGLKPRDAAKEAGYSENYINSKLKQIKENSIKKVDFEKIAVDAIKECKQEELQKLWKPRDVIAWWTAMMEDPNVKIADKIKISELIAKCHGMFITKVEIKNTNYSDILNNARKRLSDVNTINVTPDVVNDNTADNIVN